MRKDDWLRLLQHVPWGLLGVALIYLLKPFGFEGIGYLAIGLVIVYEAFNDLSKNDASYKDVLGVVVGVFAGGFGISILELA